MTVFTGASGCGRYRSFDRESPRYEQARRWDTPCMCKCSTKSRCTAGSKPPPLFLIVLHRFNHQRLFSCQLLEFPVLLLQLFDAADLRDA